MPRSHSKIKWLSCSVLGSLKAGSEVLHFRVAWEPWPTLIPSPHRMEHCAMPPGCQAVSNRRFFLLQDTVRPFSDLFFFSKMLGCLPVNADFSDGCIPHGIFKMKYSSWNTLKLAILVLFYHYLMSRQLSGKIWRSFFLSQLFLAVGTIYSWKFVLLPIAIKRVVWFFFFFFK